MGNDTRSGSSRSSSMLPSSGPRSSMITPAASPLIRRVYDGPSPTKRPRMSRTPSLLGPGTRGGSRSSTSSSSISSPALSLEAQPDVSEWLHSARQASSLKVVNVWSQLAEKYARRLDEDDIVDLEKQTIIKDNGVLSSTVDMFKIGCFADQHGQDDRITDDEQALQPTDDEPDEIDAFADATDNASRSETDGDGDYGLELSHQLTRLPPVRALDPADAADLAEFLEAEKTRNKLYGNPDEESNQESDGDDVIDSVVQRRHERSHNRFKRSTINENENEENSDATDGEECDYGSEEADSIDEKEEETVDERASYQSLSARSVSPVFEVPEDSASYETSAVTPSEGSEDELGEWNRDEGSTLYTLDATSQDRAFDYDDELVAFPSPSRSQKVRNEKDDSADFGTENSLSRIVSLKARKRRSLNVDFSDIPSSPSKKQGIGRKSKAPLRTVPSSLEASGSESENNSPLDLPRARKAGGQKKPLSRLKGSSYKDAATRPSHSTTCESTARGIHRTAERHTVTLNDLSEESDGFPKIKRGKHKGKKKADETSEQATGAIRHNILEQPWSTITEKSAVAVHKRRRQSSSDGENDAFMTARTGRADSNFPTVPRPRGRVSSKQIVPEDRNTSGLELRPKARLKTTSRERKAAEVLTEEEMDKGIKMRKKKEGKAKEIEQEKIERKSSQKSPGKASRPRSCYTDPTSSDCNDSFHRSSYNTHSRPSPTHGHDTIRTPTILGATPAHQPNPSLPDLQNPNARYHLAQALQSLSILMGGVFPPFSAQAPLAHVEGNSSLYPGQPQLPWIPYTPRHRDNLSVVHTPQSAASAPPTSPHTGSDYESSSSPLLSVKRGRSLSSGRSGDILPKSAIRDRSLPERRRSRIRRHVSFSSPEAYQIDSVASEGRRTSSYQHDDASSASEEDGEDGEDEERTSFRCVGDATPKAMFRTSESMRAQTPGPPDNLSTKNRLEFVHSYQEGNFADGLTSRTRTRKKVENTECFVKRGKIRD